MSTDGYLLSHKIIVLLMLLLSYEGLAGMKVLIFLVHYPC